MNDLEFDLEQLRHKVGQYKRNANDPHNLCCCLTNYIRLNPANTLTPKECLRLTECFEQCFNNFDIRAINSPVGRDILQRIILLKNDLERLTKGDYGNEQPRPAKTNQRLQPVQSPVKKTWLRKFLRLVSGRPKKAL